MLGPHLGDLEDDATLDAFDRKLTWLRDVHGIEPELAAHDLHPGYVSTRLAQRWPRRVAVQHHHAHVAAVAAEHGLPGPFLGLAYDGVGLGDDGTFWGGELLLAHYTGYRRLGRFSHAPMPGGVAAVRRPARMALGYLIGGETASPAPVPGDLATDAAIVRNLIARNARCPVSSSVGHLFAAAAALLGLCDITTFEGEAALRLEQCATGTAEPLAWRLDCRAGLWVYDGVATLRTLLARLEPAGFDPFFGERIPVNDGGISFGQAAIAAARSASWS
ncbi:Kae1-like domain-containing protein [Nonomuraea sp. NPDC004354]